MFENLEAASQNFHPQIKMDTPTPMAMAIANAPPPPHVLIFLLPLQGPLKCMLKLAELLCLAGIHVTLLNTHHNHRRLLRHTHSQHRFSSYPHFRFETISDGLPEDHPRTADQISDLFDGLRKVTGPLFRQMLTSGSLSACSEKPVTVVIAEGALDFAIDVADEAGIPLIHFDTLSPCALWTCFCVPKLLEAGELPFKGEDMDAPIKSVPGMEGFLRRRDLPSFCRGKDLLDHPDMQNSITEGKRIPRGHGLILNTFEELDGPILSHMQSFVPNIYHIGPLHAHLKVRLSVELSPSPPPQQPSYTSNSSLWQEDRSCLAWLDAQPPKSVLFVSVGSTVVMTRNQVMELWHGLIYSGTRFLWVRRPNSIIGGDFVGEIPTELLDGTKERGCFVSWAPQEEVLAHSAIGGFLTHSGWNSTLESMVEGVPMLCWPYYVDQQVNSRFVSEIWKVGIDMKDTCDRLIIEKMIKHLMDTSHDEFVQHADKLAKAARKSITEGGSSVRHLNRLIKDITLMSYKPTSNSKLEFMSEQLP